VPPDQRFVAFAFAAMGLGWLGGAWLIGRRLDWRGFLRWASAIDSVGIALLIAAGASDAVSWIEGLKLYAILACFGLAQCAAWWMVRRFGGRAGLAMLIAVALAVVCMSTLLWGHLPLRAAEPNSDADAAALAVVRYANPLLAANDAINPPTAFVWTHHGLMYRKLGIVGESRAPAMPDWSRACMVYLLAALVLTAAGVAIRGRGGSSE
jgi:hypothetical protein